MAKKKEEVKLPEEHADKPVSEEAEVKVAKEVDLPVEAVEGMEEEQPHKEKKEVGKSKKVNETKPKKGESVKTEPNPKKDPHGKKYKKVAEMIEKDKEYTIEEAIELLKKTSTTKFDSSVEIHVNLNVDPANADQQVKGSVTMPAGLGKEKKVAVVADGDKVKEAKDAGADFVGGQDLIEKIEKGWLEFDILVATPEMMAHVGKVGKILGTKGLMPNPKTGTVTNDVEKIIKEIKKGRAVYKIDKAGIVHAPVGKVSFSKEDLEKNIQAFLDAIHHAKPGSVKGTFVKGVHLTTTMGPSVKISEK